RSCQANADSESLRTHGHNRLDPSTARTAPANTRLAFDLPPWPGAHQSHPQLGCVRQPWAARAAREGARKIPEGQGHLLPWFDFVLPLSCTDDYGNSPDVLLPSRGAGRLPRHEKSGLRGVERSLSPQSSP